MAQEYGFFDSTSYETVDNIPIGNKAKDQTFFARYFASFIKNGVFTLNSFAPTVSSGMTLSVSAGQCFINGYYAFDDEAETKTFTTDSTQHEYWLVQRCDTANGEINAIWITDPASGLLPTRDGAIYDLVLCKVTIPGGATALTVSMIEDCRSDETLCGIVSAINDGLIGTIDPQWIASVGQLLGCAYATTSTSAADATIKMAEITDDTFSSLRSGVLIILTLANGNSVQSPSLNINSFGPVPIVSGMAGSLATNWPNGAALLVYTGSSFVLLNSAERYVPLTGGTMTGQLKAQANTDYSTYQVRNIALSTTAAVPTGNGSLLGVYE